MQPMRAAEPMTVAAAQSRGRKMKAIDLEGMLRKSEVEGELRKVEVEEVEMRLRQMQGTCALVSSA